MSRTVILHLPSEAWIHYYESSSMDPIPKSTEGLALTVCGRTENTLWQNSDHPYVHCISDASVPQPANCPACILMSLENE